VAVTSDAWISVAGDIVYQSFTRQVQALDHGNGPSIWSTYTLESENRRAGGLRRRRSGDQPGAPHGRPNLITSTPVDDVLGYRWVVLVFAVWLILILPPEQYLLKTRIRRDFGPGAELARLIEIPNALFREVAGDDY
jgi:hypothetical protein